MKYLWRLNIQSDYLVYFYFLKLWRYKVFITGASTILYKKSFSLRTFIFILVTCIKNYDNFFVLEWMFKYSTHTYLENILK